MNIFLQYQEVGTRPIRDIPFYIYPLHVKTPGPHVPIHWHEELEIILPSVPGCLEIDGNRHPFQQGDIMFVNPYELHATSVRQPGNVCHILLRTDCFQFLHDTPFFSAARKLMEGELSFPSLLSPGDPAYGRLFPAVCQMSQMKPPSDEAMAFHLASLYFSLLSALLAENRLLPSAPDEHARCIRYIKQSIRYMYLHLDEKLTIPCLADTAGLSEGYFTRLFKKYTHTTPARFLTDLKLEAACVHLASGCTVTEAAQKTGLDNISHFIRLFKQKYGITPKAYQKGVVNSSQSARLKVNFNPAGDF